MIYDFRVQQFFLCTKTTWMMEVNPDVLEISEFQIQRKSLLIALCGLFSMWGSQNDMLPQNLDKFEAGKASRENFDLLG